MKTTLIQSIINFILLPPIHLCFCLSMITSSIYLQRNGFYFHVFGVTILLLIILYKINLCYNKIKNPFIIYEKIVIIGGILHAFIPIISIFYSIVMYYHVGICFCVHVLHLSQCYQVFYDIKMKDRSYIIILWCVNIMEFFVNLAYCFPNIISNKLFVVPLVVVEICALLLSSLRLKSIHQSNYHPNSSNVNEQQQGIGNSNATTNTSTKTTNSGMSNGGISGISGVSRGEEVANQSPSLLKQLQLLFTSRILLMFLCSIISGLLLGFKRYNFQIFITGYTILLLINLIHLHSYTPTIYSKSTIFFGHISFIFLILITWFFYFYLSQYQPLEALLLFITSIPILSINLTKFYLLMGFHYTFYMSSFSLLIYISTLALYGLNLTHSKNIYIFEVLMISSIVCSMGMILTDYKLVRNRKIFATNLNDSESNNHNSSENEIIGTSLNHYNNNHLRGNHQLNSSKSNIPS